MSEMMTLSNPYIHGIQRSWSHFLLYIFLSLKYPNLLSVPLAPSLHHRHVCMCAGAAKTARSSGAACGRLQSPWFLYMACRGANQCLALQQCVSVSESNKFIHGTSQFSLANFQIYPKYKHLHIHTVRQEQHKDMTMTYQL